MTQIVHMYFSHVLYVCVRICKRWCFHAFRKLYLCRMCPLPPTVAKQLYGFIVGTYDVLNTCLSSFCLYVSCIHTLAFSQARDAHFEVICFCCCWLATKPHHRLNAGTYYVLNTYLRSVCLYVSCIQTLAFS